MPPLWIGNGTAEQPSYGPATRAGVVSRIPTSRRVGTDSEWDRDSQSGAAAVGLVTAAQREQPGRERNSRNYESRQKREIGNFWRGKLRLARFADRDRTAEQPSYGWYGLYGFEPNSHDSRQAAKTRRGQPKLRNAPKARKGSVLECGHARAVQREQPEQLLCESLWPSVVHSGFGSEEP